MSGRGPPQPPKPLVLELTTTSINNVVFSTPGDSIYYEVASWKWQNGVTVVKKLDYSSGEMRVFAEIERRRGSAPRLRWTGTEGEGEGEFKPVSDFVAIESHPKLESKFRAQNGKAFKWVSKWRHLELVSDDGEPSTKALVTYRHHRRYFACGLMSRRPALIVEQEVKDSLDAIIVAFLVTERQRRDRLLFRASRVKVL